MFNVGNTFLSLFMLLHASDIVLTNVISLIINGFRNIHSKQKRCQLSSCLNREFFIVTKLKDE